MKLKTDLTFRCSKALDFLSQMTRPDGAFIPSIINGAPQKGETSIPVRLQTISFLYSTAKIFEHKNYLKNIADAALNRLESQCFKKGDAYCLINNGESVGFWNAMMSIIYFKKGDKDKSRAFANSLLECIKEDEIICHYPPGTTQEILEGKARSPYGVFITALLQNDIATEKSQQVGDHITKTGKYDYLDLWGLKQLYTIYFVTPKYKNHAAHFLNVLNRVSIDSMSSLYAGAIMQANLAWYEHLPNFQGYQEDRISAILKRQMDCQDQEKYQGGFTNTPDGNEIRPEYIVHNVIAMIEYLLIVENWKWDGADLSIIA